MTAMVNLWLNEPMDSTLKREVMTNFDRFRRHMDAPQQQLAANVSGHPGWG